MLWDPRDLGSCRAVLPLDPVFWSRHVSDAHAVGTKRPEIQNSVTFHQPHFASCCSYLLPWENVSKALNPAGFKAFDKFSQDGADPKDRSGSNILFNQLCFFARDVFLKKKKHKNEKNANQLLVYQNIFKVEMFIFIVKSYIATRWAFYPIPKWRITPHWSILIIFIAM